MKKNTRLIIWTIVLNWLIIIAGGHGIVFLGLIEIFFVSTFTVDNLSLSLAKSFDEKIDFIALTSLIGKLFLIAGSLFRFKIIVWIQIVSILFLWTGYFYIAYSTFTKEIPAISLISGLPFAFVSLLLFNNLIKSAKQKV